MRQLREWENVTPESFSDEIRPRGEPAILRAVAAHWPVVGADSSTEVLEQLAGLAIPGPVECTIAPPESRGLLHYGEDMRTFTFRKHSAPIGEILSALRAAIDDPGAPTIAIQSVDLAHHFPRLAASIGLGLVPPDTKPRIWIGNRAKVATHNDPLDNIACVVAGRRRFTLFPPEQIGNLYLGPLHNTPAGTPISMVHLTEPDLARYPRFAAALDTAMVAELEPGDAIYIPYQWFHHVEALDPINVLVNYWWNDTDAEGQSPWDAMLHAILAIRHLPGEQRRAWRANFDHYVFLANGNPGGHLPGFARGLLDSDAPLERAAVRAELIKALTRSAPNDD